MSRLSEETGAMIALRILQKAATYATPDEPLDATITRARMMLLHEIDNPSDTPATTPIVPNQDRELANAQQVAAPSEG